MKVKNKKMNSKGISLIEASMVLALSAIVISGVMVYYQSASENQKIKEAMILTMGVNATLQTAFTNINPSKVDLDGMDYLLYSSSAIPEKYKVKEGKSIANPFGGMFFPMSRTVDDDGVSFLDLEMSDVPFNACQKLVVMDIGDRHKGTGVGTSISSGTPMDKKLINPTVAADMCDKAAKKSKNGLISVIYTIKLG